MVGKNNQYLKNKKDGTKVESYSIKKFKVGTASVVIGASIFFGAGAVAQASEEVSNNTTSDNITNAGEKENVPTAPVATAQPVAKETTKEDVASAVAAKLGGETAKEVKALDKTKLENYIAEIEAKLANGTYDSKTEESVAVLKADLDAAKTTLANATTQDELTKAYSKLVTTANTKLKAKPIEKKETPEVDTTNGQPTVGKKAENTEKKSDSNSIENTGTHDSRNGKEIDKGVGFRADSAATTPSNEITTTAGNISYTIAFSDVAKKEIYAYNEEDTDISIDVNSTAGKITLATVKSASGQYLDKRSIYTPVKQEELDGFGWTYHSILEPTKGPIKLRITGKPNDKFKAIPDYTKQENQNAVLGERYLNIVDEADGKIEKGNGAQAYGYFKMVVKSQTYKYSIKLPESNADKIAVSNIDSLTEADVAKIKEKINIQYSDIATTEDARLASKKGEVLADKNTVVAENGISVENGTVTVTYKDGSVDTTPVASVARTNEKPTVEIPYSDAAKREIYVYGAEENSFDIKIKDDADKISRATLLQGGNRTFSSVEGEPNKINTQYGYTANVFSSETPATEKSPAVIRYSGTPAPEGKFTQANLDAATKGENPPGVVLGWRYVRVTDTEGTDFTGSFGKEVDNDHAFRVMLKPQTQKYDIQTPAEADKVAVDDASDVSDAEFNKIKDKIKIEYSQKNNDARLADKKGQAVENQADRIASIKKVDNNVVVTYKDGSTDTRPLTDFARTNNAPEVTIPYSTTANGKKDVYIYANEDIDIDIKYTDDLGKIKSATIKQGGNQSLSAKDAANPDVIDNQYDMTFTQISAETPATAENPAIVKISGKVTKDTAGLKADKFPKGDNDEYRLVTRYATATDTDGKEIHNVAKGSSYETDPGSFSIVLKSQTKKYDIRELSDAEKPVVTNIDNIPADELANLKENLPLEYSKKNEDKNLEDKKGKAVEPENAKKVVKNLVQEGTNLVVTYQDDSKDTIPVEKVVKLDKQPAIDAVTNKATEQIAAINGNDKLTPAEKDKAIAEVNKDKETSLEKIADATNAADITAAKEEGTAAVAKVNPVAKEAAKQAIADTLKAKNDALDKRADLTDAEKAAAKKEAKRLADDELAKVNAQDDNKATAEEAKAAQAEVDAAKKKGVDEVTAVNPVAKEQAKKAVADKLAEVEKGIDDRTDLTLEEKAAAKEKAKAAAKTATDAIDNQPNFVNSEQDATAAQDKVNQAKDTGLDAIVAANPTAEKKPAAKKEVETEADKKKQEIAAEVGTTLTQEASEKLLAEVDAVKKASEEAIQAAKKNANVDKVKEAGKNAIAAINSVRVPANKVIVPTGTEPLSDDKQTEIKKAIEAVNPKGTKVVVNPDGTAQVTLPNGKSKNLTKDELTKDENALDTAGGGNDINRPADKVIVENPAKLTDEEKAKIKQAVRDVNPNSVVSIDDNGTVTVSTPDGKTAGFPASELVRTLADAAKDDSGNAGVRKPADKVVGDFADENTRQGLKDKATEKLKKLNGGDDKVKAIKYDDEGNATVVLKDGTIATIPASDLFKTPEEAKKANGGDDINKPNSQTVVADKNALTGPEREAIKAKIAAVNPEGSVITVNEKGEATVTTPEGKTAVIDADDLVKGADEKTNPKAGNNINNPADRVQVADKANLKPEEIAKIKTAVEAVNPGATVVVDEKGNATVTTPAAPGVEQKTATIPVSELVKTPADKDNVTGGNQVNTPADRVVVENPAALTEDDKKEIKAKIQAVNPGADVVFDANGNATVTTPAAPGEQPKTATIPAADLVKAKADLADPTKQDAVNKPADKVVVDPALVAADKDLPQEAKDAIKASVAAVNPGSTVVVDDKGNATVTTKDGKTVVIPKADLVKKESDKETAKAGNNINKPADKVVANKDALTPENIAAIKAKVEAVNPDATVVVDDKGNATVVTPDGQTATIPVTDLVKSPEEAKDAKAGNNVNKPADKVAATKADLADDAKKEEVKAKIKAAVAAVNPDATVVVDDQGNATVSTPDGKTATIPVEDLVKDPAAKDEVNGGNKVNTPATKVVVTNPDNKAADEEKIKAEILKVNPGATVAFDTVGNATVTTKDGAVATIPASDLAKDAADLTKPDKQDEVNKPADKTVVKKAGKLTQAEKDAIKAEIAKVNRDPQTTIVVDNEGNATVTTPEGKTVVIAKEDLVKSPQEVDGAKAGNNINKPADKVAAAAADLVGPKKDEVAAKIKAAVESVNPGATVFVDDKGNATVTTPDGKTATIPVEDLLKDPAAKDTPSAGNKVNTPAEKALVDPAVLNNPKATLPKDVKDAIQKAVESVNLGATVVVDDKGNATVTVTNPDGTKDTATIPASDLVKSNAKEDLENAAKQDAIKKPIDQTVVADKDALTSDDIKAIKAKVQEVNPDATVVVDDKGNATVTTKDGKTAVIAADDLVKTNDEVLSDAKAGNLINKPADRVFVKDGQITDDVKAKIAAKVQRINPGATVFVDDKGNATVTTPEGKTATIPVADLTKTDADKDKVNAGNKINSPADRVLVKDRDKLTAEDIQEIEKNILEVNPGATVVFDAKGNATVKNVNGDIATIPVEALAKPKADLLKPEKQDLIKKPVDKVLVTDPANVDKDAIKKAVEEVNPGSTVVVDDKGNATITTEDGRSFVIPAKDLVKTAEEAKNAKAGNNINKPADKVAVTDPTKPLSPEEKKAIEAKIKEVNPDAKAIFVDDKGNATVTIEDKDGNTETATIPAADLVTSQEEAKQPNAGNKVNTPADKVVVTDPDHLSDEDKAKITEAIKAVNPEANVVFDDKGNATVTTKDGEVATIPAADLVKTKEEAAKPEAGNNINTPADKVAVDSSKPLTKEEQDAIAAKVAEVNPGATVAVDDKGNATVTTTDGKTAVIPAAALTKTADSAKEPNAGNDVVKPADKTVVANPESLTTDEQNEIAAKVKAVNPGAEVVVDDKGNATVTVNGKAVVIPAKDLVKTAEEAAKPNAGNDVNTPADKTVVANPNALTPEEKKAIEDKVKAVNPGAEVVVDDKGNATVTTPEGKTAVIPATDLTKTADSAKEPNAGNDVVKPADKTVVANPESLTQEEKDAIVAKVKAVNPDATVVVDEKGNATVTPKDGKPVVIPASDLTKSPEDATKPNAGNDIVKPADKTVVANKDALTPEEKKAIEDKVKAVNPGAEVVVDDKGNATVTKDGKVAVIPATDLVKSPEDATKPNAGNDVSTPADKTVVANPNALTPEEKKAIEDKVKAVNPGATVAVDDKGNATVTTTDGKTAVIPAVALTKTADSAKEPNAGNDVVKPADKTVVANPESLTTDEQNEIAAKVKAVNPEAKTVIVDDKGNATVTTKDGKAVVIPAKDLVKTAEEAAKPNAGNDVNTPADKTVVANPNALTPEEKKAIEDKVKAVNPGAAVAIDDKGNATVTKDGKTAVIPATDLTKSKEDAAKPNAGNDIVKPASKTKVANPDALSPEEKKAIAAKVEAVNPGAKVVVDDKGNATVTLPNGNTAVIPASDLTKSEKDVNDGKAKDNAVTPAAKTKVANPEKLTDAEKKAIEDKVKALNPGSTVVVDDKGNATVVKDGNVSVIPSIDLVKVEDDAKKENGGNDANTPAAKTVVADSANLTDEEKAKVKKAVEAVNPGSTVVVDNEGNATVMKADGTVLNIPASDLVIPAEKFADEAKNAKVKTPTTRTLVGDKDKLTDAEKAAVKKAIEAVNPGATVVVDDKGNATVTSPDGSTATISKDKLVKNAEEAKAKNGGDNLDIDLSKVPVVNINNITPEEKAKFQFMILGAITDVEEFDLDAYIKSIDKDGNTVYTSKKDPKVKITIDKDGNATIEKDGKKEAAISIDNAGNVTIVTKEGQVLAIPRDDAFRQKPTLPGKVGVGNVDKLTDAEKAAVKEALIKANPKLTDANITIADNGDTTIVYPDGQVIEIPGANLVTAKASDNGSNGSNGNTGADTNAADSNAQGVNAKLGQRLANTGTTETNTGLAGLGLAVLGGLLAAARRRKEK